MQEDQLNVMCFNCSVTILFIIAVSTMSVAFRQTTYDTHTDTFGSIQNNMLCGLYEIRVLARSVPENRNTAGLRDVVFIKYFI
jgi:hypothetical protein